MANRDNHYEAAFEAYLRQRGIPYVAVDEARRSLMADGVSIKSLDFIVSSPGTTVWLVDVKGRRFPSGDDDSRHYWKNWSTSDDLRSLGQWESLFGENFRGLFVFAYHVLGDRAPLPPGQLFEFRGGLYGFVGVGLANYAARCHRISPRWDTVAMPTEAFRQLARPVEEFLKVGSGFGVQGSTATAQDSPRSSIADIPGAASPIPEP
jgi:hypothetical protein